MLALAGCSALPKDPERTAERVSENHRFTVGTGLKADDRPETRRLLGVLSHDMRATPSIRAGELEPMLAALKQGRTDLVVAWFDEATPWQARVTLGPPLARVRTTDDTALELRAAMRNGENRWIMAVERASRRVATERAS
ncbi:hypothetical protein PQ455_11340 [Sphingomonas naphthae]|uniref:Uncharacterized protein n=1 Tax=Sphingomonas naphthae TaxID=1813468 RepID=A0ABY7TIH9_9SPHN|nr:hypothetical protein [Sphingomonas naphthae]WCT72235.1 hypothetical protein PQ455_11340 [Sphingomonas naphthae]